MNSAFRAGLLVGVVVATALPAHAVTLVTWYDAPSLSGYSDGAAVGTLPDLSASGNTGNGVTPGTYVSGGMGGLASVVFQPGTTGYASARYGGDRGIVGDNP